MAPTPKTVYRLKVSLSNERGKPGAIWRIIEISSGATLEHLHRIIFRAFDRHDEHLWSFFFGKPYKKGTIEYSRYLDEAFETDALLGTNVKLNAVPLATDKEVHYLFDFGDEWWHRIEFLAESPPASKTKYPRIVERKGESPPQYENPEEEEDIDDIMADMGLSPEALADFEAEFDANLPVTYETLEEFYSLRRQIMNPRTMGAYLYGLLSDPLPAPALMAVTSVSGPQAFLTPDEYKNAMSIGLSLCRRVQDAIEHGQFFRLERPHYPAGADGVLLRGIDLLLEIRAFLAGMQLSQNDEVDDLLPEITPHHRQLADEMKRLQALLTDAPSRLPHLTPEQLAAEAQSLDAKADSVGRCMHEWVGLRRTTLQPVKITRRKKK